MYATAHGAGVEVATVTTERQARHVPVALARAEGLPRRDAVVAAQHATTASEHAELVEERGRGGEHVPVPREYHVRDPHVQRHVVGLRHGTPAVVADVQAPAAEHEVGWIIGVDRDG